MMSLNSSSGVKLWAWVAARKKIVANVQETVGELGKPLPCLWTGRRLLGAQTPAEASKVLRNSGDRSRQLLPREVAAFPVCHTLQGNDPGSGQDLCALREGSSPCAPAIPLQRHRAGTTDPRLQSGWPFSSLAFWGFPRPTFKGGRFFREGAVAFRWRSLRGCCFRPSVTAYFWGQKPFELGRPHSCPSKEHTTARANWTRCWARRWTGRGAQVQCLQVWAQVRCPTCEPLNTRSSSWKWDP